MYHLQKPKIAHIILAAGTSSRMGSPKQLLPWNDTTLIGHTIQEALKLENTTVFVVLGAYYELIYQKVHHFSVNILENLNWEKGMGSSICAGVCAVMQDESTYNAVLISLADQPLLDHNHYELLISELIKNPNSIIATNLGKRIGVPGIFPACYFDELSQLNSDYGARYIIANNKDKTIAISARSKEADIDTMQEYRAMIKGRSHM